MYGFLNCVKYLNAQLITVFVHQRVIILPLFSDESSIIIILHDDALDFTF